MIRAVFTSQRRSDDDLWLGRVMSVVAKGQRKEFFRWFSTERPKPTEIIRFEPAFIGVREDKMTVW